MVVFVEVVVLIVVVVRFVVHNTEAYCHSGNLQINLLIIRRSWGCGVSSMCFFIGRLFERRYAEKI